MGGGFEVGGSFFRNAAAANRDGAGRRYFLDRGGRRPRRRPGQIEDTANEASQSPEKPDHSLLSAVVSVTRKPGRLSDAEHSSPCKSAMAATRFSPRPLPGVERAASAR